MKSNINLSDYEDGIESEIDVSRVRRQERISMNAKNKRMRLPSNKRFEKSSNQYRKNGARNKYYDD